MRTSAAFLLLTWSAVALSFEQGFVRNEQIQAIAVSKSIQNLIFAIRNSQEFELSNTISLFPLGKDFFELIEYLQVLKVDKTKLVAIRKFAYAGVYQVRKDIFAHQLRTLEFVTKLAELESQVRYGTGSAERLFVDLQAIQEYSDALATEVLDIITQIQELSAEFAAKIEDAIGDLIADVAALNTVRQRATELGQAYTEKYVQYSTLTEKVKGYYLAMIPVFKTYIKVLETKVKGVTV